MKIIAIVEFNLDLQEFDIDPAKIVGESVSVKSGEYENLLWGGIISAELIDDEKE